MGKNLFVLSLFIRTRTVDYCKHLCCSLLWLCDLYDIPSAFCVVAGIGCCNVVRARLLDLSGGQTEKLNFKVVPFNFSEPSTECD